MGPSACEGLKSVSDEHAATRSDRWKCSLFAGYTSRIRITSPKNANWDKQPPPRRGRKRDRFTGQFSSLTRAVKARFWTGFLEQQLNQFTQHQITKPLGGAYSDSTGGRRNRDGGEPVSPRSLELDREQNIVCREFSTWDGSPNLSALRELFVRSPRRQ